MVLYVRRGRELVLTEEGVQVAAFGREVLERVEAFRDRVQGKGVRGSVTLAAGEGAYLYLLGAAIRSFGKSKTALRLLTANREETLDAVRLGRAHVGVTVGAGADEELHFRPLTRVGQVFVMPKTHRLASSNRVMAGDLGGEALIVPPAGRPHRRAVEEALRGVAWKVAVEASGWELMLHFAKLGVGTTIVNASCRIPPGLIARPMPELPTRDYVVLHRPGLDAKSAAGKLVDVIVQRCTRSTLLYE